MAKQTENEITGTIIKGVGGLYTIYIEENGEFIEAVPRGVFRKLAQKPMVGDKVKLSPEKDAFTEIFPRKSEMIRPKVANVDCVVFVLAAVSPKPDLLLLDKQLCVARSRGIEPILIINKADQDPKEAENIKKQYENAVQKVICTSIGGEIEQSEETEEAEGGKESNGTQKAVSETADLIKAILPKGISVFTGQSGVGKSTIINALMEESVMETGTLSKKSDRGKHTTRHSEMFLTEEGKLVIDSPGYSLLELEGFGSGEIAGLYPEITEALSEGTCRFQDCMHLGEPGCVVTDNVKKGLFDTERYGRYVKIIGEIKEKEKYKYK